MNQQGPGKIDWTDFTWNPVTGCYHGCSYCYARLIAERFTPRPDSWSGGYKVARGMPRPCYEAGPTMPAFALGFAPTFWPSRIDEPHGVREPSRIFVSSMGDLFGEWVPADWPRRVQAVAESLPRHTFQFLTKNPERLAYYNPWPPNCWVGASATDEASMTRALRALADVRATVRFVSAEPLLGPLFGEASDEYEPYELLKAIDWLIVGAQTGPGAKPPDLKWMFDAGCVAALDDVPIWHKDSLQALCPETPLPKRWPKVAE
ncbi:MAG: DUF5131 family protein [Anaerolineae bacterium]